MEIDPEGLLTKQACRESAEQDFKNCVKMGKCVYSTVLGKLLDMSDTCHAACGGIGSLPGRVLCHFLCKSAFVAGWTALSDFTAGWMAGCGLDYAMRLSECEGLGDLSRPLPGPMRWADQ
jgi:hypothetical protein